MSTSLVVFICSLPSLVRIVFVGHRLLGWDYAMVLLVVVQKKYFTLGCVASHDNSGLDDLVTSSVSWFLGLTGSVLVVAKSCQRLCSNANDQLLKNLLRKMDGLGIKEKDAGSVTLNLPCFRSTKREVKKRTSLDASLLDRAFLS